MKKQICFNYESSLATFIEDLIAEKRASGYKYNAHSFVLKEFDRFCVNIGFNGDTITKELSDAWAEQRATEGLNSRNIRVRFVRQLSLYILSTGRDAYVPKSYQSVETKIAHVFSSQELQEFFSSADSLKASRKNAAVTIRECQTLFRLYYCLGMRLSEPLELTWDDLNLDEGWLKILDSKGHKDRILWLNNDLIEYLSNYKDFITQSGRKGIYVFPSSENGKRIRGNTVRYYFNIALAKTSCNGISNPPTIKSFRHTFVVDRLNMWIANGENIQEKLPYLCKFLGHKTINETVYYYHQVDEALKIVRSKDLTANSLIPEVKYDEI